MVQYYITFVISQKKVNVNCNVTEEGEMHTFRNSQIHTGFFLLIVDIDECMTSQPCHANATCNNTVGSYMCTCVISILHVYMYLELCNRMLLLIVTIMGLFLRMSQSRCNIPCFLSFILLKITIWTYFTI